MYTHMHTPTPHTYTHAHNIMRVHIHNTIIITMCMYVFVRRWDWCWQVDSDRLTLQDQFSRWEKNIHCVYTMCISLSLSLSLSRFPPSLPPSFTNQCPLLSTNHPIMYTSLESIETPIGMHVPLQPVQWSGLSAVPLLAFQWVNKIPHRRGHSSLSCSSCTCVVLCQYM